jgi:Mrp family chromosome partitioning ATPase
MSTVLIAAFAVFVLSAGFTATAALLVPPPAPGGYAYNYALAGYGAPAYAADPHAPLPPQPVPQAPPYMASPPIMPAMQPMMPPVAPVSTVEQLAYSLRQAGEAGRRVAIAGSQRNAGTTYAAITLARALAKDANVVLVDFAFGAPNLSVISTDPNAPGIAELVRGAASFGDVITRDQFSNVHLVATGQVGADGPALAASPMLATVIEALAQSYNYVVIDAGAVPEVAIERLAPLAQRMVLVAADPADAATRAARERLAMAGRGDITLLAGAAQAAAA